MKVLITDAAGAHAHQLKKKLGNMQVILGDYAELPALLLKAGQMLKLPHPAESSYVHQMLALSLDERIESIYPLQAIEFELLNNAVQLFAEYGINILYPGDEIQRY